MPYSTTKTQHLVITEPNEQLAFGFAPSPVSISEMTTPTGYTGLAAFHKYWGKKPTECLGFLIEKLTTEYDLILDPFVGSGLLARECAIRQRRFIGIDINPFSIELANLISDLPSFDEYTKAINKLEHSARLAIDESYCLSDRRTATHHLWDKTILKEIWIAGQGRNGREVFVPSQHDIQQASKYADYTSRLIRPLGFFQNRRINTNPTLGLSDLFTGRALRNIDILLQYIHSTSGVLRRALLLTLTASIGQMSNMVFAITGRGKRDGTPSDKVEVGSWVIGYWRPPLHFEINVWNCFQRRAHKLSTILRELGGPRSFHPVKKARQVLQENAMMALVNDDSIHAMREMPNDSVSLVLTDPPHSDRIPYLELSELWNAILGVNADFSSEIVVSNARERSKTKAEYNRQMKCLLSEIERVLKPAGLLALLFNARDAESWDAIAGAEMQGSLSFLGCFPMSYSANSVVQDNRDGAMKSDFVLLYIKKGTTKRIAEIEREIEMIPGWSSKFPKKER
jgi:SAM-dependent methyltransferase